MSESIPVVHPIGCYAKDGTFYSWEETRMEACPYRRLIGDYECLVYHHSLEREGKRQERFWVLDGDDILLRTSSIENRRAVYDS